MTSRPIKEELELNLNDCSISLEAISYYTKELIPQEITLNNVNVIFNRAKEIVAVFMTHEEINDEKILTRRIDSGFQYIFFYQEISKKWKVKTPDTEFEEKSLIEIINFLKSYDHSLMSDSEIMVDNFKTELQSARNKLQDIISQNEELSKELTISTNYYKSKVNELEVEIAYFKEYETKRIYDAFNLIENKEKFLKLVKEVHFIQSNPKWEDNYYGKYPNEKIKSYTIIENSKLKWYLNFKNETWLLKLELFDFDTDRRYDYVSKINYFQYSHTNEKFIEIDKITGLPFWLDIDLIELQNNI